MTAVAGFNRGIALAGTNEEVSSDYARANEKPPLALFAAAAVRPRRTRRSSEVVPHHRHGRFPRAIERMLARERPEIPDYGDAELERLLTKHADIAEGRWSARGETS